MDELLAFIQTLDGLPLHSILLLAVVMLWRKVNALEQALIDCLRANDDDSE